MGSSGTEDEVWPTPRVLSFMIFFKRCSLRVQVGFSAFNVASTFVHPRVGESFRSTRNADVTISVVGLVGSMIGEELVRSKELKSHFFDFLAARSRANNSNAR